MCRRVIFPCAALLFLGVACVQEPSPEMVTSGTHMVFTASYGTDLTRTSIREEGQVWWSPKESIHVFNGTAHGKFTSTNTEAAAIAAFEGELALTGDTPGPYLAVYPYNPDDTSDGVTVTTTVPSVQKAGFGNIADGMSPAVARTESTASPLEEIPLSFRNVCSGLKFSLQHSDVTAVRFRGNAGETVAGKVQIAFDEGSVPGIAQVLSGEKEIRLAYEDGAELPSGTVFYLTLIPQAFPSGFTLSFDTPTMTGNFVFDKETVFRRSVWKTENFIDSSVYFSFPDLASVAIDFIDANAHGISANRLANDEYALTLSGSDPYVFTDPFTEDLDPALRVVEFEYSLTNAVDLFQLFFVQKGMQLTEQSSRHYGSLPASETYRTFRADIKDFRDAGWGKKGDSFRFDPGQTGKGQMKVRNFVIREMTEEELQHGVESDEEKDKRAMGERLTAYLVSNYPSSISRVSVTADKVTVEGACGGNGTYLLAEITPWQDITEMKEFPYTTALEGGSFLVTLDRSVADREGITYDRLFSKWAVVKVADGAQTVDSHARYADEVAPVRTPEAMTLKNKKGLGAGSGSDYYTDMDDLGLGSITMNIVLEGIVGKEVSSGTRTTYGGHSYQVVAAGRNSADNVVTAAYQRGAIVSAILLAGSGSVYKDPENTGGNYTMPNLTTAAAFNQYAAALNFIVARYSDPKSTSGKTLGHINHWIMHNEVDQGLIWTNMGNQTMERYLDRYIKSMRICYNIVRQYDPEASILGSFTHSWASEGGGYSPKAMLERTVTYSEAEGDFRWGVAYHPYPQNLSKPQFWIDDVEATDSDNSPFITFKNLEVIDRWIRQPRNLYNGTTKRVLFLSENGTSSPTYSDSDLAKQAAGACWAWKKVQALEGIDAIQWHSWQDNATEAAQGLRLGLHTLAEQGYSNYARKPVWYVWQAAGTDQEDAVFAPYLDVIGISSWDALLP